jgi:transcription antitermination factor NusG
MKMDASIRTAAMGSDADLFSSPSEPSRIWYVLHTKSRQEKVVAADLASLGLPHFLPLVSEVRHYADRKAKVALPLFPGYVFVRGSLDKLYPVDRNKRLVNIIPVAAQNELNWELKNLNMALLNDVALYPYEILKRGTRVEVRSGPLRGLQGLIENRGQADRLVLQVEMLGRAMSLEIEASLLDPI